MIGQSLTIGSANNILNAPNNMNNNLENNDLRKRIFSLVVYDISINASAISINDLSLYGTYAVFGCA